MKNDFYEEDIINLSIKKLFKSKEKYLIPIYQRNYTWTKSEVEQLLMDIKDYAKSHEKNYYIGTLVVFEKKREIEVIFEIIDGQQRLTTFFILLSVLKNEYIDNFKKNFNDDNETEIKFKNILEFESRNLSTKTLKLINENKDNIKKLEDLNPSMKEAYLTISKYLKNIDIPIQNFISYLLSKVIILRVKVPKDTDLNHYFEIMNSRGEQLEKHEILKTKMLGVFNYNENSSEEEKIESVKNKNTFNSIWEACSDLNRYVQYGFGTKCRDGIFGQDWNKFIVKDFNDIKFSIIETSKQSQENIIEEKINFKLEEIIDDNFKLLEDKNYKNDNIPQRFTSPINFQNFLLHVLKIMNKDIQLDDKNLLDITINQNMNVDFIKEFGFNLLRIRFLFDNYVIKREYSSQGEWSLLQAYKYEKNNIQFKNRFENKNENNHLIKILSMFHVSNPSQIYKYWLTGVLNYLFYKDTNYIIFDDYLNYLEKLAKLFLMNRYLAIYPANFDQIIFQESLKINNISEVDYSKLNQGTNVEHFIFNYFDYLIWKKEPEKFNYFNFSFSNSVEHFYPQNPIKEYISLESEILNNFGNLCLISISKNAKLNNHPPESKIAYYPDGKFDSLKQHKMMDNYKNKNKWSIEEIENHRNEMINLLIGDLNKC